MRLDTEISSFMNLRVAFGITCSFIVELFRKRYDERCYYFNCTSWPASRRLFGQSYASLARLSLIYLDSEFLSLFAPLSFAAYLPPLPVLVPSLSDRF